MAYKPTKNHDTHGCYLRVEFPRDLTMTKVLSRFPEGQHDGTWEPEKGYYERECRFIDTETSDMFNVYAGYGMCRIGAFGTVTEESVEKFNAWLLTQV